MSKKTIKESLLDLMKMAGTFAISCVIVGCGGGLLWGLFKLFL